MHVTYGLWRRYRLLYERLRGIDFLQPVSLSELGLDPERSIWYANSGNKHLERVLKQLPIDRAKDQLFDYGCGKGSVLALGSRYFPHVGGIELSPHLITIAAKNMQRLGLYNRVELHHGDAATFTDLQKFNFFYLFNPFTKIVMEPVLQNIMASLQAHPRSAWIIYKNPVLTNLIETSTPFHLTKTIPADFGMSFNVYEYTPERAKNASLNGLARSLAS